MTGDVIVMLDNGVVVLRCIVAIYVPSSSTQMPLVTPAALQHKWWLFPCICSAFGLLLIMHDCERMGSS
jgi:hypothetical protein